MFELIVYLVMLSETLISDSWVTVHSEFARCGGEWLWPNRRFYPRHEENHKSLFRIVSAPSDIQARHLLNSSCKLLTSACLVFLIE